MCVFFKLPYFGWFTQRAETVSWIFSTFSRCTASRRLFIVLPIRECSFVYIQVCIYREDVCGFGEHLWKVLVWVSSERSKKWVQTAVFFILSCSVYISFSLPCQLENCRSCCEPLTPLITCAVGTYYASPETWEPVTCSATWARALGTKESRRRRKRVDSLTEPSSQGRSTHMDEAWGSAGSFKAPWWVFFFSS